MRKRTLLLSIAVAGIAGAVAFGWVTIRRGFSARDNPSPIEKLVATTARQLAVPSQYRQLSNPLSSSYDLHAGMEHFADHCATCHANDGSGDTLFGKGLYPKPPDMRQMETQNKGDGELYYTIENGIRLSGMPAFGEEHAKAGGHPNHFSKADKPLIDSAVNFASRLSLARGSVSRRFISPVSLAQLFAA
jgi:mono/diheme cytochrome c family protein